MEDINNWQAKFESCQYADRLIDKLTLINKTAKNLVDIQEVKKAIYYAKEYHKHQKRYSGEPYHIHPISVANIVADYSFDTEAIITALLHDIIEDTTMFTSHIKVLFNSDIALLVDQLSRINTKDSIKIKLSREEGVLKAAYFSRKALIVKLADRLDNMRTIKNITSLQKRKVIAQETIEVFVPLAKNAGLEMLECELRDCSLKTLSDSSPD